MRSRSIRDRVKIVEGGSSSQSTTVNQQVTVWYKAVYKYDSKQFDGSNGSNSSLIVNGEPMNWSIVNQRWEKQFTSSDAKIASYKVSGIKDLRYNLVSFSDARAGADTSKGVYQRTGKV